MEFSAPTRSQPSGSSLSDSIRKTFHRPQQSPSGKPGSDVLILKVEEDFDHNFAVHQCEHSAAALLQVSWNRVHSDKWHFTEQVFCP